LTNIDKTNLDKNTNYPMPIEPLKKTIYSFSMFLAVLFAVFLLIFVVFIIISALLENNDTDFNRHSNFNLNDNTKEIEYENYLTENCDWIELSAAMRSQLNFTVNVLDYEEIKNIEKNAKQLEQRGLKPCKIVKKQEFNDPIPQNEKFEFKKTPYAIDNYYLKQDINVLYKVSDNLFTGIFKKAKEYINEKNSDTIYKELQKTPYTILLFALNNEIPQIVEKHNIDFPKDLDGPYYLQISRKEWLVFNTDLTICNIIKLENNNNSYNFIEESCLFDNQNNLLL